MIKENMVIARVGRTYSNSGTQGNPRYTVIFTDGTGAATGQDCSVNYGITNSEFQGVPLRVEYNDRGDIAHICTMDGRFQA